MTHPISTVAAHAPAADTPSKVDIGIVTIRDDEFRAVLARFPDKIDTLHRAHRTYTLRHADAGGGERYRIAVLRLIEQGQGEAQDAARDLIDDLAPRLVLVVGIAGGRPSDDVRLGDVVVSTRIHDFTIEARKAGAAPTYDVTGGPIDKALAALIANLAARDDELGDWTAGLPPQPPVSWTKKGQLYGPADWQRELREKLEHHHGPEAMRRAPSYAAGPIASSDRLVKDPDLLNAWLQNARTLLAIEMESGGVYRAARERCPMLAIRGISDIVGLKRVDAWTKYACASAAAFTCAFLRTRPIALGSADEARELEALIELAQDPCGSLSVVVAKAYAYAKKRADGATQAFFRNELEGYEVALNTGDPDYPQHRTMLFYCSPTVRINPSALNYNPATLFSDLERHEHFVPLRLVIGETIASIEQRAEQSPPVNSILQITRSFENVFPEMLGNAQYSRTQPVMCYAPADSYKRLLVAIRASVTQRLLAMDRHGTVSSGVEK